MKEVKKNFKVNRFMIAAVAVIVTMLFLAVGASSAEGKVYKARLSYHWGPKHYSAIMASKLAEECKKATSGRLDIEVFPSGQLFNIKQILLR